MATTAARALPTRAVHVAQARARFGPMADRYLHALHRADPLADAVAHDFAQLGRPASQAMLDTALRGGISAVKGPPASLVALFEQLDHVPEWVDWRMLDAAGRLLFRSGFAGGTVLGTKSLMTGYVSPGGNKALVFSGQLRRRARIGFRIAQTSRFVVDVCNARGMRRFGPGFAATVRVRVMHAAVRRLIERSEAWQSCAWGAPINQHDMAGTTLLFSGAFLQGLREFGLRVSDDEARAYMALWRYNGLVMGVEPELLARDERSGMQLAELIKLTQGPPDDDARALVHAMVRSPLATAPKDARSQARAARAVQLGWGFTRRMLGDELADQLEIPNDASRHVLTGLRLAISRAEALGHKALGDHYARACARTGRRYWEQSIALGLAGRPAGFVPPLTLEGLGLRGARTAA